MKKAVRIHELDMLVDFKEENGLWISDEITLDETKQYTFEMVKEDLVTGIMIIRTPAQEPIMTKAELKEKYSVNTFAHFCICHVGKDKIIVCFRKDCTSIKRYVKQTEHKKACANDPKREPIPGYIKLELMDGTIINGYTPEDIAACCATTAANTNITVGGVTFRKDQVLKVWFGDDFDLTLLQYFGLSFTNLIYINQISKRQTKIL